MEKNTDKKVIVVDADVFSRIMYYAGVGAGELGHPVTLADMKRHVRKFNPLSQEVQNRIQEEKDDLARDKYIRIGNYLGSRMVSERWQMLWNEKNEPRYYQQVLWYVDTGRKQAWPVVVVKANKGSKSYLKVAFTDPEHVKRSAMSDPYSTHQNISAHDLVRLRKDIPEGFEVFEIPAEYTEDEGSYIRNTDTPDLVEVGYHPKQPKQVEEKPKVDLRTGNECCADPCVTFDGKCENCGDEEKPPFDPEVDCCENEDRDHNGGCRNCGDPCL